MNKPLKILLIVCVWIAVLLPLAWGVYQSVLNSLPLFVGPSTAEKSGV